MRGSRVIKSNLKINLSRAHAPLLLSSAVCVFITSTLETSRLCTHTPPLPLSLSLSPFLHVYLTRPTLQVASCSASTEDVSQRIFPRYRVSLLSLFFFPIVPFPARRDSTPTMGLYDLRGGKRKRGGHGYSRGGGPNKRGGGR